jgi:hypothetical protein
MMPAWIAPAAELAGTLGRMIADWIAGRKADAEAARLAAVPKLRALADVLESHPAREAADHDAAVDEATRDELARRALAAGEKLAAEERDAEAKQESAEDEPLPSDPLE